MLNNVIFYALDKTIKQYRQFAQSCIDQAGIDITVDQWLVLNVIKESPTLGQAEIGERVFKDQASVARIINLLEKKNLLQQIASQQDKRRVNRLITVQGQQLIEAVTPVVLQYRNTALRGIPEPAIEQCRHTLELIFANCQSTTSGRSGE